jgi:predicted dehydrogenase
VACSDVRREAAADWSARYSPGAAVYTDYVEMVRKEALDGLLLATWPNQHREQVETCLAAGARNILCEKALTLTGREAVEIWQMVRAAKAFLMEGFMYRHNPAIRRLEKLIADGEIGTVDNIRAEFGWDNGPLHPQPVPPPEQRNWRLRRDCGGGVPYDATCYAVNACGHFARALPTRVFATGTVSRTLDVVMRLFGVIDYANGVNGVVLSSHGQQFSQELQVEGSAGHLHLPLAWTVNGESTIQRRHTVGWAQIRADTHVVRKADSYQLQLENFIAALKGQARPLIPLAQSVANTFVIDALVTSVLERRPVEITLPAEIAAEYQQEMGLSNGL